MDGSFLEFQKGGDTLRVYEGDKLIFSSTRDRLFPLLDYIDGFAEKHKQVVIYDKLMGNAAALLSVRAGGSEVFSPLGSELAVKSLQKYRMKYHLGEVVPYIQRDGSQEMCPMEKLSLGKEPDEFYRLLKAKGS